MSAALVRKSLSLVDSTSGIKVTSRTDFALNNKELTQNIKKKNNKDLFTNKDKLNIEKARQKIKSKEETLERNLRKLELIKKICTVDLDEKVANQLFQRATNRGPVKLQAKKKHHKEGKTVFTEDDFKRFEEEYMMS